MSITLQLDLPDSLIEEARTQGLLEPGQIGDLLAVELRRRQAASDLQRVLGAIRSQPGEPLAADGTGEEIAAARAARRTREAGR